MDMVLSGALALCLAMCFHLAVTVRRLQATVERLRWDFERDRGDLSAEREGGRAFLAGLAMSRNPYDPSRRDEMSRHHSWNIGWRQCHGDFFRYMERFGEYANGNPG